MQRLHCTFISALGQILVQKDENFDTSPQQIFEKTIKRDKKEITLHSFMSSLQGFNCSFICQMLVFIPDLSFLQNCAITSMIITW